MRVCVHAKGSDPESCLLLGFQDNAEIQKWLHKALPWCLPDFQPLKAAAIAKKFTDTGGIAETCADCTGCQPVANLVLSRMTTALPKRLLALNKDRRLGLFSDEQITAIAPLNALGLERGLSAPDDEGQAARAWAAALRSEVAKADETIARLRTQLRFADVLQLVTAMISAASVTTLLGLIFGSESKEAKVVVAIIGLVAAWFTGITELLRRNVLGNSRVKDLEALVKTYAAAESVALDLEIWAASSPPRTPLDPTVLERAHSLVQAFIENRSA